MQVDLTYDEIEAILAVIHFAFHEDAYENALFKGLGELETKDIMKISNIAKDKLEELCGCSGCLGCGGK